MDINKAIDIILSDEFDTIDHCTANGHPFFCTCGVGFDAKVSEKFAKSTKRGPLNYVKALSENIYAIDRNDIKSPHPTAS